MSAESITLEHAERPFFAGVDVGGTTIKIGLVDDGGRTLAFSSFATEDEKGPEDGVARICKHIDSLLSASNLTRADIQAVGLGTPGTMDIPAGKILEPHNLPGWKNFPIRDELAAKIGKQVSYANDAGAAAYGEYWVGSGRKFDSIVLLTLGTGVGGGIIINGKSIDGANSHGAECGHVIVDTSPNARMCPCGRPGHLEGYASATGLVGRAQDALRSGAMSSLANKVAMGESLNGLMISQAAEDGDELANQLITETAGYLATGLAAMAHVLDPEAMIIGGAMTFGGHNSELGQRFLKSIIDRTKELVFPVQAERLVVDFASLGSDAGYIGAAGISRDLFG